MMGLTYLYQLMIGTDQNYRTPLFDACLAGDLEQVKILVERKNADVNYCDVTGSNPLFWAVLSGKPEVVRYLITHGADFVKINNRGRTPLVTAIEFGLSDVVQVLIDAHRKAEIDIERIIEQPYLPTGKCIKKDSCPLAGFEQPSLLFWACSSAQKHTEWNDYPGMVHATGRSGYGILDIQKSGGLSAMPNYAETIQLLIAAGANVHRTNRDGDIPLFMIIFKDHTPNQPSQSISDCIKILLAAGSNLDHTNHQGETFLSGHNKAFKEAFGKIQASVAINKDTDRVRAPKAILSS